MYDQYVSRHSACDQIQTILLTSLNKLNLGGDEVLQSINIDFPKAIVMRSTKIIPLCSITSTAYVHVIITCLHDALLLLCMIIALATCQEITWHFQEIAVKLIHYMQCNYDRQDYNKSHYFITGVHSDFVWLNILLHWQGGMPPV